MSIQYVIQGCSLSREGSSSPYYLVDGTDSFQTVMEHIQAANPTIRVSTLKVYKAKDWGAFLPSHLPMKGSPP